MTSEIASKAFELYERLGLTEPGKNGHIPAVEAEDEQEERYFIIADQNALTDPQIGDEYAELG